MFTNSVTFVLHKQFLLMSVDGEISKTVLKTNLISDSLGYAEVCIQCSLSAALERNSKRSIPIPHSTIESMERRMELPEPAQHHWEKRSMVVRSDCEQEQSAV